MAYAIFESGSKQYRVQPGDVIEVERLDAPRPTSSRSTTCCS